MNKLALPLFVLISLVSVWGIARSSQLARQVKLLEEANLQAQPLEIDTGMPSAQATPAPVILQQKETVTKMQEVAVELKSNEKIQQLKEQNTQLNKELSAFREKAQLAEEQEAEEEVRREERRVERAERVGKAAGNVAEQFELLAGIDTTTFPQEYAEAHVNLLETLASINQVMTEMAANPESAGDLRGKMHDQFQGLREGLDATREGLMYDMITQDLGFQGEEAKLILDDINLLNDITDMGRMMRGMWGGNRGPGRGGNGGGGGPPGGEPGR